MTTITKSKGVQSPLPALPQLDMLSITQSMLNSKHLKPKGIGSHLFERLLMTDSARQAQGPCNLEHETEQTIKWIDKELVLLRNPYNRASNKDTRQLSLFDCGHIIDDLNEDRSLIDDPAGLINKRDCLKALRTWLVKHYASK
tara:strand:- start:12 stop:440 length:429 start_codon:yes stop_codon:yes gene_type:complete